MRGPPRNAHSPRSRTPDRSRGRHLTDSLRTPGHGSHPGSGHSGTQDRWDPPTGPDTPSGTCGCIGWSSPWTHSRPSSLDRLCSKVALWLRAPPRSTPSPCRSPPRTPVGLSTPRAPCCCRVGHCTPSKTAWPPPCSPRFPIRCPIWDAS